MPHRTYGTELKNTMERLIQHIKDTTDTSTTISAVESQTDCDREHISNRLKICVMYVHMDNMDTDGIKFMTFLVMNRG